MRHTPATLGGLLLSLAFAGLASAQVITPAIAPSRTSGAAPLAVHFDATATAHSGSVDPFHDLFYEWSFDDPSAGTWRYGATEQDRNVECCSALAAHVFDEPGSYTVSVKVRDAQGNQAVQSVTIDVADPDAYYAGKTSCVSTTNDFTGCPAGAHHVSNESDFDDAFASRIFAGDHRILFGAGQTFDADRTLTLGGGHGGTLGAFGNGKAIVHHQPSLEATLIAVDDADWRIVDLDVQVVGGPVVDSYFVRVTGGANALVYRNDSRGQDYMLQMNSGSGFAGAQELPFIVDNDLGPSDQAKSGNVFFHCSVRGAIMGNFLHHGDSEPRGADGHLFRSQCAQKVVFAHNSLTESGGSMTTFRAPNQTRGGGTAPLGACSQWNVWIDNFWDGSGSPGNMTNLLPSSPKWDECITDFVIERNHWQFSRGVRSQREALTLAGRNVTVRNNLFDLTNGLAHRAIRIVKQGPIAPIWSLTGIRLINNTCFVGGMSTSGATCIENIEGVAVEARNNLLYVATPTVGITMLGGSGAYGTRLMNCDNNGGADAECAYSGNPFLMQAPVAPTNFRLDPDAGAAGTLIDANASANVLGDFLRTTRPAGARFDIGAFEHYGGQQLPPEPPVLLGGGN